MSDEPRYTSFHMCLDVRGVLRWPDRRLKGWVLDDDGRLMTPREARNAFMDELAKGHEKFPVGKCDNFDWKLGCRGHKPLPAQPSDNPVVSVSERRER